MRDMLQRLFMACALGTSISAAPGWAGSLYHGGDILTLAGDQPEYVEALLVENGRIRFAGDVAAARHTAGDDFNEVDLQGRFLMPGFIDAHSHLVQTAHKLSTVPLDPPPAGHTTSIADIVERLKSELEGRPRNGDEWLFGWGFDNGMLEEQRFPTRQDLDAVSSEVPILVMHFSGHMLVMNSAGLARAGYGPDYEPPEGGAVRRGSDGSLNGVIEETAMLQAIQVLTWEILGPDAPLTLGIPLKPADKLHYLKQAQALYLSKGFTTISEMAGSPADLEALQELARAGDLQADVLVFMHSSSADAPTVRKLYSPDYRNHLRVGGAKINLDGGSPGRTAYLREPYHTPTPGQPDSYRGYSSMPDQTALNDLVASYYDVAVPLAIHALGDAAIDQCIAAVSYAEQKYPREDIRTQLIHLQVIQEDQFDDLKALDVTLTYQNTHNYYFADFHNKVTLGPQRTRRLTPVKSSIDRGFSTTVHHDSPVHPVDQLMLVWIAANRQGRSGTVYGPEEIIPVYQALRAVTIEGAWQFREDQQKGSLEVGKLADMVVLSQNPLKTKPGHLRDIQVLETIKAGNTVYSAP